MSTDTKLTKVQLYKIIQSRGSLGKTLGNVIDNLGRKSLIDLAVLLAKDIFPKLATKDEATSSDETT